MKKTKKERKKIIADMKALLLDRKRAVKKSHSSELQDQNSGDIGEVAAESYTDIITAQLTKVETEEMTNILGALNRCDDGTFGLCGECGNDIPLPRLKALPYATHCIKCQTKIENENY